MKTIDFESIRTYFNSSGKSDCNEYRLVDPDHPLKIMIGNDECARPTLLLLTKNQPKEIPQSSMISITVGKRNDGAYSLLFSLTNYKFLDQFCNFCVDMIRSSRNSSERTGMRFFLERYALWKKMLETSSNGILSEFEIKGLIGELYFLKENLSKKCNMDEAVKSWCGPLKADQDFMYKNEWYEIKTTSPGNLSVKVSSVEQLDTEISGNLVIMYFDKASEKDTRGISLNKIVIQIKNEIADLGVLEIFDTMLLKMGYFYNREYDHHCYHFHYSDMYKVDDKFPCLRKKNIPNAIGHVHYELIIANIEEWRIQNESRRI